MRSLLPAVLMYKQILDSSSKSLFSLTGLPHPLGFPPFSPPMRVWCLHLSYRKQKKNRLPLNVTPHLPPTFILILWSLSAASTGAGGACDWLWGYGDEGPGRGRPLSSPAPGGDVEARDQHEVGLAEVDAALQALRHALQRFQVLQRIQLPNLFQVNCKGGQADEDVSEGGRGSDCAARAQPATPTPAPLWGEGLAVPSCLSLCLSQVQSRILLATCH